MSITQPPVRLLYKGRKPLRRLREEMHTRDYFTDPERAAPALTEAATRSSHRSDPAHEKIPREAAGSYDRALAVLIIAIANIRCGPSSMSPPSR